jgi:hypothetical protein
MSSKIEFSDTITGRCQHVVISGKRKRKCKNMAHYMIKDDDNDKGFYCWTHANMIAGVDESDSEEELPPPARDDMGKLAVSFHRVLVADIQPESDEDEDEDEAITFWSVWVKKCPDIYPEDYKEVDELEHNYLAYFAKDCKEKYPEDYKKFKADFHFATNPATMITKLVNKACGHRCCLETTEKCCHCEDKRPADAKTIHYGSADASKSTEESREFFYCPHCKNSQISYKIDKIMDLIRTLAYDQKKELLFKLIESMNE